MDILKLIDRSSPLFYEDIHKYEPLLLDYIKSSKILVIGGAGSIGKAVALEIFKRNPKVLHVIDISENNLVELVRTIRSDHGYIQGEFKTFAIDCGSSEYELLIENEGPYDYIFNLSALKHVRSEKDPYTLMRMIKVNIFNTLRTINLSKSSNLKKYFCVSTDKAANPVNMMGASKKIMELFLMRESSTTNISTARFANVAFSDGSLLHGFNQRFLNHQPIAAPNDVKRYFITPQESGELCILSAFFGENKDIFFPKLKKNLHLIKFSDIAKKYISLRGYEPYMCSSEDEARTNALDLIKMKQWPCYFSESDTTGEKDFEEFHTADEQIDLNTYSSIGVIKNNQSINLHELEKFEASIESLLKKGSWTKTKIVKIFEDALIDFNHNELGKFLDDRM